MAAPAFSSTAEDVITRILSVTQDVSVAPNPTSSEELSRVELLYEVEWTANEIRRGQYKQVALQFPDELLHISVPIYQSLRRRLDNDIGIYVLADTSYGSCCVDEVAAAHIDGDIIVHYGYSCLSRPSRLPVLYVFSKAPLDAHDAAHSMLSLATRGQLPNEAEEAIRNFILIPDVSYLYMADDINAALLASPLFPSNSQIFFNPVPKRDDPASTLSTQTSGENGETFLDPETPNHQNVASPESTHRRCMLPPSVSLSTCTILYIGPQNLGLTNLLMTHPQNKVISYNPSSERPSAKVESARTNKLLMRRYALVQRARDADVIGIVVGTLGVASYLPLLAYIRDLLRTKHKKSYTLSVGKLSPSKLANFAEIECFVMVACPENSVIDAKEFLRPIVTPFELFLALSAEPSWPGNYVLDFKGVIDDQLKERMITDDDTVDLDKPSFSLVTGKYRHAKRYGDENMSSENASGSSAVVLRNTDGTLAKLPVDAGAEFLSQRTFKGLEERLGQDAPSILEEGRRGIPKGYQDDHGPAVT